MILEMRFELKIKSERFTSQRGSALIEVIVAAAIGVIVALTTTSLMVNMQNAASGVKFRSDADSVNEEMRALLSSPQACLNTFGGMAATTSAKAIYVDNVVYGDRSLKLNSMQLTNFIAGASTITAQMTLISSFGSGKQVAGPSLLTRAINISLHLDASNSIISCIALSKMSDGIWQRSTANLNNITFNGPPIPIAGGYVGIGTSTPANPFEVSAELNTIPTISGIQGTVASSNNGGFTTVNAGSFTLNNNWSSNITNENGLLVSVNNLSNATNANGAVINVINNMDNLSSSKIVSGTFQHNGQGNVPDVRGSDLNVANNWGSVGNAAIYQGTIANSSWQNITNAYGVNVAITNAASGTINNAYGVYIGSVAGTNAWGLFENSGSNNYISGRLGLGTKTPQYQLEVVGDINIQGDINTTNDLHIATVQVCDVTGCNPRAAPSDARLKKDVRTLENSLDKILKLRGVSYSWIDPEKYQGQATIGVIAQETENVYPEVVKTNKSTGFKAVAYDHLVGPIIEAIKTLYTKLVSIDSSLQKLNATTETQSEQLASLKARAEKAEVENQALKVRLDQLEALARKN
jgi:hypothetical protein